MKKLTIFVCLLCLLSIFAFAQDKLLNLDDIFSPDAAKRVRFSGSPVAVQWSPDGKSFKQIVNGRLIRVDALTGNAAPYFDSGSLVAALMRVGIKADEAERLANSQSLQFNANESGILLNAASDLWFYDIASKNLRRLTNNKDEEKEADLSPDGKLASFVRGNNLFVVDIVKASEKQLTRDGREGERSIYNGYLDWIYEEELYGRGQKRGYWWSPDSRLLAFLRLDEEIGIAGGTVSDERLYDSIYTERYMMTPQNNSEGYEKTSVSKAAKNLSGKLLLIHGQIDDNVHMQNTTQLAYELQRAGKQFDIMYYPTQRHGITNQQQVHHWYTMMTEFILRNL